MGCGTSSAKPAPKPKPQQTVQKKTSQENTTSDQAEKVHVGTNGTGHTAVPASGSQINVQIDANGGTDSAAGAPAVTQDNLQGQGATAKSGSENRGRTDDKQGNASPIGVRNQSIHNPRNTRQTARSGSNYLSRNDPSQNLTPRVKASPTRAYTAGGYPPSSKYVRNVHTAGQTAPVGSPRRNGRFQPASRAKSLPSRAEQALLDERMSDPAYRKKILVESSERLKAMEKNSPRQENDGEATVSEATNAEFKGTDVQNSTKHSAQNENTEANKGQTDKKMSERKADGKDATKSKGITTRSGEAKTGQSNQKTDKQKAGGAGVPNNPQQRQNAKGSGQNKIDDSPGKKTNPTAPRGANRLTEGGKSPENVGSKQNPGEEPTKSRHWKSQLDQPTSPKRKRYNQQTTPRSDDPNERARSRRIRFMLREATKGNDVDELDEAIYLFESNELADNGDLTEALKRLELLQLRRDLRVAIIRRNRGVLTTAIDDTYVMKHDKALRQLLDRAEELRDHLQALDAHSHDILHMDQKLISEIRSYCKPPPSVHEIMAACYMLLGVPEDRLLEWGEVQSHVGRVGRGSLRNLIIDFNPDTVPVQTLLRVKEILNFYHLADVRIASNGAASFYLWAENMVELIDKRRPESQADDSERVKSSAKKG